MKKRKSIGLWVGICFLFLGIFGSVNVLAAVTEGKAGETLTGEYAVIINTDTSDSRNAGSDYHLCNRRREIYLQKQWQRQDLYMHWDW